MKARRRWTVWNPGINLALIVLAGFFCSVATASEPSPPPTAATQDQATAPPTQNAPASPQATPSSAPAKTPPGQTHPAPAKRTHHKKRVLPANCDIAPADAGQAASSSASASGNAAASGTVPAPRATPRSTNCPPPKVVVRQGGTSEPSIQLAGGTAGDQASHQRDTDQLLAATEANLKKIADRQLTPTQHDMVNQIHQFMDQSKAAVQSGDLDRAGTLAWKAKLLSEELVKPEESD